ncbi:hypothetical protein [uncultured Algimonas sp.]|uniref:hypothetical protein n=1 Tax=uncultured Algimonas sp. TaxID=1547920 RepID=UPI00261338CB|nr:hypothetical protein [uncultured Algimonas sp.]
MTACATTTSSPIDSTVFQDSLRLGDVTVSFAEDRAVPGVYDKAVAALLDADADSVIVRSAFSDYINANGGRGAEDDQLGERYLEYRIAEEVAARLRGNLTGERDVDVTIDIEKIATPNAATMLLIGEVKGINYDMDVTDAATNAVLIDLVEPSNPFVERSSVLSSGLLGMAARTGSGTHIKDLEQMVFAVAEEVSQIMTGAEVNKGVAKKIRSTL